MDVFKGRFWFKRFVILSSFIVVSLIVWNTYVFFQKFKQEEKAKMELFAATLQELSTNSDLDAEISLINKVYENFKNIPLILTDEEGVIHATQNLDSIKSLDPDYLKKQLFIMKKENAPIQIQYKEDFKQLIYYKNSDLLKKLTYYPIALLLILILFLAVLYLFYSSNRFAEQNLLWTGMAKETAHQIGTPLSSLLGWVAILKEENVNPEYIKEIEKDVDRLNTIANRFSKIGSLPELQNEDIVAVTRNTFRYLKSRSSKQIEFKFNTTEKELFTNLNTQLYGWVIENLIKNAIDAMQGKGNINVFITKINDIIKVKIKDTGKGIPKSKQKEIFKAGYTTKKRGWGLGLSLSKRIIEDYHDGRIYVSKSEVNKGTTFEILLKVTNA